MYSLVKTAISSNERHESLQRERTNAELAKTLEECTGPIAHFLQAVHEMTGFHWTILGAGPDPQYDSDINVMSYHTGTNKYGQNWKQATPDFDDKHLKPYVAFILTEHIRKTCAIDYVLPTPSSTLGTEANPVAGESQSSNATQNLPSTLALTGPPHLLPGTAQTPIPDIGNMHPPPATNWYPTQHPDELISWDNGYDFSGSGDFGIPGFQNPSEASTMNVSMPSSSLSACLDSPSILPTSLHLYPQLFATSFALSTPPSDSLAPFFTPPMFTFPTLPAPIPTPDSSTSAPVLSTTIDVLVSHGGTAVSGQSLPNLVDIAENNSVDASIKVLDTLGMGTPDATAVVEVEATRVNSNNIITSSKPKGRPTRGKHVQQVPADSETPNDSNSTQPVRKTGCVQMETTRLTQANNIGQNLKHPQHTKPQSERPKKKY
ncbi:uncharacterized protein F5891DRAFT_1195238 [Suillus fuscotomentosus]|uniref:Uncharacterized protein n=1 Tax=Suillus fuscotomentosus TaxID=1912939 RepID=A0AAD4HFL6_9AGAM|nr:uncharacterized protein F5891DRAFT_1195238 [Suillus fuscotomentosus]KAG1894401.1 hypothetical protein F5891DRAFT_1195238 [Suillus fuscotomentosus]